LGLTDKGTVMRISPLIASALLLTACASAPPPQAEPEPLTPEVQSLTDRYGPLIEEAARARLAAEAAGDIPRDLEISTRAVEEDPPTLLCTVELHAPALPRGQRDYVVYCHCAPDDLDTCATQIVSGAKMLATTR